MKGKTKYITDGAVTKSNRKIVKTGTKSMPFTPIHMYEELLILKGS
jgi:hypothetical protein